MRYSNRIWVHTKKKYSELQRSERQPSITTFFRTKRDETMASAAPNDESSDPAF